MVLIPELRALAGAEADVGQGKADAFLLEQKTPRHRAAALEMGFVLGAFEAVIGLDDHVLESFVAGGG